MKKTILLFTLVTCFNLFAQKEIYEIRTYELFQSSNFNDFNSYFKDHFIPVLNQNGIKNIGVFQEVSRIFTITCGHRGVVVPIGANKDYIWFNF